MAQLKVTYKDIDELKEYTNNPRRIPMKAIDAVANSIRDFGMVNPIIVDKDNIIVAGHTRLKACKKLGIRDVPTICLDDLPEEKIKAFRLADNKTGEFSQWDPVRLDLELGDILEDGIIDMSGFGFADIQIPELVPMDNGRKDGGKAIVCPHCGEEFYL